MAGAVRTHVDRSTLAGALLAAGLCSALPLACRGEESAGAGTDAGATAEGGAAPAAPAALPDAAEDAVDALLQRCHGVLRGARKMANALVVLRRSATDEHREQVILASDDLMHVTRRDGQVEVRLPSGAWRVTRGAAPIALDAEQTRALDRFQTLLRAALLEPLYRAETVRRQGPTVFQLIAEGGETWRLEVASFQPDEGPPLILPRSLSGPAGEVTWLRYRHNGTVTHLPRTLRLGEFGEVWYDLEDSDLVIDPSWFGDPLSPKPEGRRAERVIQDDGVVSLRVGEPVLGRTRASRCLVLPDPGSWPARYDLVGEHGRVLAAQGQESADLDFIFERDGRRFFAMPFTMALDGGRPFVARPGQVIERLPDQRAVLLRPPKGSLASCERKAREILARFVEEQGLEIAGPLRLRPLVEMGARPSSMDELEQLWVQCELPVK